MHFSYTIGMVKKKKWYYPPARYRYLEKHKSVTAHLTLEDYNTLKGLAEADNKSVSEFVKSVLFNFKGELDILAKKAYNIGYNDGANGLINRYGQKGANGNEEEERSEE